MRSLKSRARSRWREFAFVFHEVQGAIEPHYGLGQALKGWEEVQNGLAESHRKRKTQEQKIW
jgi:hypothetical protein